MCFQLQGHSTPLTAFQWAIRPLPSLEVKCTRKLHISKIFLRPTQEQRVLPSITHAAPIVVVHVHSRVLSHTFGEWYPHTAAESYAFHVSPAANTKAGLCCYLGRRKGRTGNYRAGWAPTGLKQLRRHFGVSAVVNLLFLSPFSSSLKASLVQYHKP